MYNSLKQKVISARHLKRTHELTGLERNIVYYIYREIITCTESNKFRRPHFFQNIETARVDLFDLNIGNGLIYIDTIYSYGAKKIKAFECEKNKIVESINAIESAVELVGLKFEKCKQFSVYCKYQIYYLVKKENLS